MQLQVILAFVTVSINLQLGLVLEHAVLKILIKLHSTALLAQHITSVQVTYATHTFDLTERSACIAQYWSICK